MANSACLIVSLFLFLFVVQVYSITIKTAVGSHEVYSGPGGQVTKEFSQSLKKISPYFSVETFIFSATTNPEYEYEMIQEVFGPPQVNVIKGTSVKPILFGSAADGYFFDPSSDYAEFPELSVYFNCQEIGFSIIEIVVNTSLIHNINGASESNNEQINFFLQKECHISNIGNREGLLISKNENSVGDVVKSGVVQNKWSLDSDYYLYKNPVIIPEDEHISLFKISISTSDYGNQYFEAPIVTIEDTSSLDIVVRGNAHQGGVATTIPEIFYFMYTCKAEVSVDVKVEISLGFYGKLRFGFTKDCKKKKEETEDENNEEEVKLLESGVINVGTSRDHFTNVVENNKVSYEWNIDNLLVDFDKDEIVSVFYISTKSGHEQHFLKPIISVSPANAFKYTVTGPARNGNTATGNPQRLIINYICDRVSEAEVIVSIKLPGYETVEFGFTKHCTKLIRHTGHVWTANQLMIAMAVGVAAILVVIFLLLRKQQNKIHIKK